MDQVEFRYDLGQRPLVTSLDPRSGARGCPPARPSHPRRDRARPPSTPFRGHLGAHPLGQRPPTWFVTGKTLKQGQALVTPCGLGWAMVRDVFSPLDVPPHCLHGHDAPLNPLMTPRGCLRVMGGFTRPRAPQAMRVRVSTSRRLGQATGERGKGLHPLTGKCAMLKCAYPVAMSTFVHVRITVC